MRSLGQSRTWCGGSRGEASKYQAWRQREPSREYFPYSFKARFARPIDACPRFAPGHTLGRTKRAWHGCDKMTTINS